jgi:hypothetical protein
MSRSLDVAQSDSRDQAFSIYYGRTPKAHDFEDAKFPEDQGEVSVKPNFAESFIQGGLCCYYKPM